VPEGAGRLRFDVVDFGILGATEVRAADGRPVTVGGPRVRALLALLLLDAGHVVTTDRLIDALYGADPPRGAANALQSQVSRLRRGLGDDGSLVEFHPAGYRLVVDPDDVDVHRFGRLAAEGRRALAGGDHAAAAASLRAALDLWRGPALADVRTAPFAAPQATRLDERRLAAVEDHAAAVLALGRPGDVVDELHEIIAAHPLRERARALLMRALYGSGRPAEALEVFEEARRRLADELGADPSPELAEVHLAVLRGDPALSGPAAGQPAGPVAGADPGAAGAAGAVAGPAGPVPPSAAVRSGLPGQLTSFIGREDELTRVGKLLAAGRLVTLTGPGGSGKTRLAVEAADREHDAGEICFVDLAPLGDGTAIPGELLTALGLREAGLGLSPGPPGTGATGTTGTTGTSGAAGAAGPAGTLGPIDTTAGTGPPDPLAKVIAALADRRLLLVLDNCEHVIDDAARLVHRLLVACPGLRVLATSREALAITGEVVSPVPPLSLPPAGTTALDALDYPAVRLFADRAAAVRPDFQVDSSNSEVVTRICAALDGLPLAIELAAARLRALTAGEVAARLDDRFRLLSRGDRTKAERHRTLRAVVEWSWDLLDEAERTLARRLTVFAGGASLEAAAEVCGLAVGEADELLAGLTEKSFVQRDGGRDGGRDSGSDGSDGSDGGRYRMLDTVRVFCAERLAEAGEAERVGAAHTAYFLGLAETAGPYLIRAAQLEWLARLTAEHSDLLAALRRAAEPAAVRADPAPALRLLAALAPYWWLRGTRGEGVPPAMEILTQLGPAPPPGLAEEYIICVMIASYGAEQGPAFQAHLDCAETTMAGLDRPWRRPIAIVLRALANGPPTSDVGADFDRDLEERLLGQEPWPRALWHFGAAFQYWFAGELSAAEAEFETGLAAFRALGERWGMSAMMAELARLADWRGDRERARALADEALELFEQLGAAEDMADLLCLRAEGLVRDGDLAAARAEYERAAEAARRSGAPEKLATAHRGLAEVARLAGDIVEARRLLERALGECATGQFGADWARAHVHISLGRLAVAERDATMACRWHRQALALVLPWQILPVAAEAIEGLAGAAALEGAGERAALLLGVGVALRGTAVAGDPDVAQVAARAEELIGAAAFAAAYERGAALSHDAALAHATTEAAE
jgi:predicted ATPase/DNA-binding SARP family transcriptional activator